MQEHGELQNHKLIGVGGGDSGSSPKGNDPQGRHILFVMQDARFRSRSLSVSWENEMTLAIRAFISAGNLPFFPPKIEAARCIFLFYTDKGGHTEPLKNSEQVFSAFTK